MSALNTLKLVVSKPQRGLSPVVLRRNKLSNKLNEQIQLATAKREGKTYAPTKQRKVTDAETGDSKIVQVPKRIKEWWFATDSGKLCVALRYGAKVIELSKGKSAVELAKHDDLVPTLEVLKQAVQSGELDAQLEAASGAVRAGFKK
jgi:hypothetical protein